MNIYELRKQIRKVALLDVSIEESIKEQERLRKEIKDSNNNNLIERNNDMIQSLAYSCDKMIYNQNELGKEISHIVKDMPITTESILDIMSVTGIDITDSDSRLIRDDIINSQLKLKSKNIIVNLKDDSVSKVEGYISNINKEGIYFKEIDDESVEDRFIESSRIESITLKEDYKDSFLRRNSKNLFEHDMIEAGRYGGCEIIDSVLKVYFEFKTLELHCCIDEYDEEPCLRIESIELESNTMRNLEDKYLVSIDVSTFECRLVFSDGSKLVYSMVFAGDCDSDGSYAGIKFNQILRIENN